MPSLPKRFPSPQFFRTLGLLTFGILLFALLAESFKSGSSRATNRIKYDSLRVYAETAKLLSSRPTLGASFGSNVDIDGSYAVVGSPGARIGAATFGRIDIFERIGDAWNLHTDIEYPGTAFNTGFGSAVAISGEFIAVGAPRERIDGVTRGAVYIFERTGATLTLRQLISAPNTAPAAAFGSAVALQGDALVVGAPNDQFGSAFIFERINQTWEERIKLSDIPGHESGLFQFGSSVSIDAGTVAVGAPLANVQGLGMGAVVVFVRNSNGWVRQMRIVPSDGRDSDRFGASVAVEGSSMIIGSSRHNAHNQSNTGSVYSYARISDVWTEIQEIVSPNPDGGFDFGQSVGLSANRLVVGQGGGTVRGISLNGAAFEFTRTDGQWNYVNRLVSSDPGPQGDRLGSSVAIQGNKILCGAPSHDLADMPNAGAVYAFVSAAGAPDLRPESDSGLYSTDNITKNRDLVFDVAGISSGATVELVRNGQVVDLQVVTGTTATFVDLSVPEATYQYSTRQIVNGEASSLSDFLAVTVDTSGPMVAFNQSPGVPDPSSQNFYEFNAVFNESVVGFEAADVSLAESTADISNAVVTLNAFPSITYVNISNVVSDGQFLRATIPAGRFTDLAGNPGLASTSTDNTVTIDNVRPSVIVNQAEGQMDPATNTPIRFSAVFSEPVRPFGASSVQLSTNGGDTFGAVVAISGTGNAYEITISNINLDDRVLTASIPISVQDIIGNYNFPSTSTDNSVRVDNVVPRVTVFQPSNQPDPTNQTSIFFGVNFTEPVIGFEPSDFSFEGSTINTDGLEIAFIGGGPNYSISFSNISSTSGVLVVSLPAGRVTDRLGNANSSSNNPDNSITIDRIAPTVSINQAATQADPANTLPIVFTVVFSEPIQGFTASDVLLTGSTGNIGSATRSITGSGPNYAVSVGGLTLTGGTVVASIRDLAVVDAAGNLSLPSTSVDNAVTLSGGVSFSGRVTTPTGQGLRNTPVTLTTASGVRRTVTTSSFGVYSFDDVALAQVYTVSAFSKRYRFTAREVTATTSVSNLDFVGLE